MTITPFNTEPPVPRETPPLVVADTPRETDFREQLELAWRRRWLILIVSLVVFAAGMAYTVTRRAVFESVAQLVISTTEMKTGSEQVDAMLQPEMNSRDVATQVAIMGSPDLLDAAYNKLTPKERVDGWRSAAVPAWATTITSTRDVDIVTITTHAYKPELAAKLADLISETYLERDLSSSRAAVKSAKKYVEEALHDKSVQLDKALEDLAEFKGKNDVTDVPSEVTATLTEVATLRSAVTQARADYESSGRRVGLAQKQLNSLQGSVPNSKTITENPDFATITTTISGLENDLITMRSEYTENSPEIKEKKAQIEQNKARLKSLAKTIVTSESTLRNPQIDTVSAALASAISDRAAADVKYKEAFSALTEREQRLSQFPQIDRRISRLGTTIDALGTTVKSLQDQYYSLSIQEYKSTPIGQVMTKARPSYIPSYPQKTRSGFIYILLGLFAGIAAALVAERMDTRIHDPGVVERMTNLPTLSAIPDTEPDGSSANERLLIGSVDNSHAFLESFRLLRNNIAFSTPGHELKVLAVTSASKAEGKSTVSVNLAIAMAMDGKRVLLIDGDLRRPTLHNWMQISREIGFTSVVTGFNTLDDAIQQTAYENLDCLTSGPLPPNPTEFLNSPRSRQLVEEASKRYDLVIIDSPPCAGLSDVQVISTLTEGMLLVATINSTIKQHLAAAMRMLIQANAPVLGTVINRIDHRRNSYGYYSYYYYYYYSAYQEDVPARKKGGRRKRKSDNKPSKS